MSEGITGEVLEAAADMVELSVDELPSWLLEGTTSVVELDAPPFWLLDGTTGSVEL